MAIETDADRLAVLSDWSEDGIYGGTKTLTGIYDEEYVEMNGMSGYAPVFTCRTSDVTTAGVAVGGTLVVTAGTFTVQVPQPDGTGFTKLILEAA